MNSTPFIPFDPTSAGLSYALIGGIPTIAILAVFLTLLLVVSALCFGAWRLARSRAAHGFGGPGDEDRLLDELSAGIGDLGRRLDVIETILSPDPRTRNDDQR